MRIDRVSLMERQVMEEVTIYGAGFFCGVSSTQKTIEEEI